MNMIEKVVRVLYPDYASNCPCKKCKKAKTDAILAIAAMREPSKEMLEEVSPHTDDWVERYWKPAIDAALKEERENVFY